MKILQKICFVLLLGTISSVYGGSCIEKQYDMDECRVRAEQGDASAQNNLAGMYYLGQGVTQDYKEAVKWFRKSAEQGHVQSQNNSGWMYYTGKGVHKDFVMAHMYWNLAAVSGHKSAIKFRGLVEKQMTSSQLAEAQELAREWMQKHQ